jgi:hypothetical protein
VRNQESIETKQLTLNENSAEDSRTHFEMMPQILPTPDTCMSHVVLFISKKLGKNEIAVREAVIAVLLLWECVIP